MTWQKSLRQVNLSLLKSVKKLKGIDQALDRIQNLQISYFSEPPQFLWNAFRLTGWTTQSWNLSSCWPPGPNNHDQAVHPKLTPSFNSRIVQTSAVFGMRAYDENFISLTSTIPPSSQLTRWLNATALLLIYVKILLDSTNICFATIQNLYILH